VAHDASTNNFLNYTKIAYVTICNNALIDSQSMILPNDEMANNTTIGKRGMITKDIHSNNVYVGNSAEFICTIQEYIGKNKSLMENGPSME